MRYLTPLMGACLTSSLLQHWPPASPTCYPMSADVSQVAFRFCKYLGLCTYADLQPNRTVVLVMNTRADQETLKTTREALACFGATHWLQLGDKASLQATRERLAQAGQGSGAPVALVQRALLGVGPEITHPFLAPE